MTLPLRNKVRPLKVHQTGRKVINKGAKDRRRKRKQGQRLNSQIRKKKQKREPVNIQRQMVAVAKQDCLPGVLAIPSYCTVQHSTTRGLLCDQKMCDRRPQYTPEEYAEKQLQEIKQGRLAMLGVTGLYFQAQNSGMNIVDQLGGALSAPEYYAPTGYFFPEAI